MELSKPRDPYLICADGRSVGASDDFKEAKRVGKALANLNPALEIQIKVPASVRKSTGLPSIDALRTAAWSYDRNRRKWQDANRDLTI